MTELPTGTVTFLFTDLEGSTRLWEQHPEAMRDALARDDEILRDAVEKHDGGAIVKTTGDGATPGTSPRWPSASRTPSGPPTRPRPAPVCTNAQVTAARRLSMSATASSRRRICAAALPTSCRPTHTTARTTGARR